MIGETNPEETRLALANAGPITNAALYNNGKALWEAILKSGVTLPGGVPVGAIMDFSGVAAPSGWLLANGDTIPNGTGTVQGVTANFADLYAVIGSTYGGAGQLPDLRGRVTAGRGTMGATAGASNRLNSVFGSPDQLGAAGGDQSLQSHSHTIKLNTSTGNTSVLLPAFFHTHQIATRLIEYYADGQVGGSGTGGLGHYRYNTATWATWQHPVTTIGATIQNFTGTAFTTVWVSETVGNSNYPDASVSFSNESTGSGNAQNVQPTMLINKIIRYAT